MAINQNEKITADVASQNSDSSRFIDYTDKESDYVFLLPININDVILDRYKIIRKIGKGGFGAVFEAFDLTLNKNVALKFLDPGITKNKQKFIRVKREINISQKITDEKIIKIFSLEKWRTYHFFVMELVEGKNLKQILSEKGRLEWEAFKGIFFQILEGLNILHKQGIIHRDLKPSNIMITENNQIKILDFGLSKEILDVEKTSSIGDIVGSPLYMSPEQIQGETLDIRSDIYQIGLILYYALSGIHPYEPYSSTMDLIFRHLNKNAPKISNKKIKIPKFIEYGIQKCIEKKKKNRFQSIDGIFLFFKRAKVSLFKRFIFKIFRSPLRFILPVLFVLGVLLIGYSKTIGSTILNSVETKGKTLIAKNKFGFNLWEKEFEYPVSKAFLYNLGKNNVIIPGFKKSDKIILAMLDNPLINTFDPELSIQSDKCDERLVVLNSNKGILSNQNLSQFTKSLEFVNTSIIRKFFEGDIDNDNNLENIFWVSQTGMYPSAFVYRKGLNFYSFVNPGYILDYRILEANENKASFLVFGHNNPMAHLRFISETNFKYSSYEAIIYSIGNMSRKHQYQISEFLYFLPSNCKIKSSTWKKNGKVILYDVRLKSEIILSKNYQMTIKTGDKVRVVKDNPYIIRNTYMLLDSFFSAKKIKKNYNKAYGLIKQSLEHQIKNPFLKSAILYLKGDLEVEMGKLNKGVDTLKKSLEFYPFNNDACQRLCEIEFLRDNPLNAIKCTKGEIYESDYYNNMRFWGLASGKVVFQIYCYLQSGNFNRAKAIFNKTYLSTPNNIFFVLNATMSIFNGNYSNAVKIFKESKENSHLPFSIAQKRLVYARSLLLKNLFSDKKDQKELKRAKFYFKDLIDNSILEGCLAEVSHAYFLAKNGKVKEAFELAKKDYNKIINKSKGNFDARLWIFYDSFIYGKTMELLGYKAEAVRGYKDCIKANSFTDLAKRAKARLEQK